MTIKIWYGWLNEVVIAFVRHLALLLSFILQVTQKTAVFFLRASGSSDTNLLRIKDQCK
jgi:hypothetical protein